MKNRWILFFMVMLLFLSAPAKTENSKSPKAQKFDSQPQSEDPVYKTTFPEAPGMTFDVPKDTQITNINNSVQIESPTHYMFRKAEAQDRQINDFKGNLQELSGRLSAAEGRIKKLENAVLPEQKPAKTSLSTLEQKGN